MAILKEEIQGTKIINEIKSSNIKKTEYDTETKKLVVEFNNGFKYEYEEVPHQIYTKFRMSESQGKFFNSEIAKKFKYKKTSIHCWNMDIVVYRLYRRSWFWFYIPSHLTFETEEEAITFCNNMNSGVI